MPSSAWKYSSLLNTVKFAGFEEALPLTELIFATSEAVLPLNFHSSIPFVPLLAEKYSSPL